MASISLITVVDVRVTIEFDVLRTTQAVAVVGVLGADAPALTAHRVGAGADAEIQARRVQQPFTICGQCDTETYVNQCLPNYEDV